MAFVVTVTEPEVAVTLLIAKALFCAAVLQEVPELPEARDELKLAKPEGIVFKARTFAHLNPVAEVLFTTKAYCVWGANCIGVEKSKLTQEPAEGMARVGMVKLSISSNGEPLTTL